MISSLQTKKLKFEKLKPPWSSSQSWDNKHPNQSLYSLLLMLDLLLWSPKSVSLLHGGVIYRRITATITPLLHEYK